MLKIESKPKDEMIADGINSFPDECCGFMFGKEEGDMRSLTTSLIVHTSKDVDKHMRFELSPIDYLQA